MSFLVLFARNGAKQMHSPEPCNTVAALRLLRRTLVKEAANPTASPHTDTEVAQLRAALTNERLLPMDVSNEMREFVIFDFAAENHRLLQQMVRIAEKQAALHASANATHNIRKVDAIMREARAALQLVSSARLSDGSSIMLRRSDYDDPHSSSREDGNIATLHASTHLPMLERMLVVASACRPNSVYVFHAFPLATAAKGAASTIDMSSKPTTTSAAEAATATASSAEVQASTSTSKNTHDTTWARLEEHNHELGMSYLYLHIVPAAVYTKRDCDITLQDAILALQREIDE